MTRVRYKTEKEMAREAELYGEVYSSKYYLCDYCDQRSEVKTQVGEHLCGDHYLRSFLPSPVPDYDPKTDGDYGDWLVRNNID